VRYSLRNGVPTSVTQYAAPGFAPTRQRELGIFIQDQWTIKKLTMNLGARFDDFRGWVPEAFRPGGDFVPEYRFARIPDVPTWHDFTPRLGAAYDLFGNARTAIKVSAGRYLQSFGPYFVIAAAPSNAIATVATRTWNDVNGNFNPDCDLKSIVANGECGALSNARFGTVVQTTRYASDVTEGWGRRQYNWQTAVSVQQELWPGTSVNVGYFRTWYGNIAVTQNAAVSAADFDPFCVTVPSDPRLPGGGGNSVCGFYDVKRSQFGQVNNVITQGSNFGTFSDTYNGVEAAFNMRFGRGGTLGGGVSTARTTINLCPAAENPNLVFTRQIVFCETTNPWSAQTQFKLNGAYPLPWGLQASAVLQNLPGPSIGTVNVGQASVYNQAPATMTFTNAQIAPSLGRNLSACPADTGACTATVTLPIYAPYSIFEPRFTQLDVRFTKKFRFGGARLEGDFDIYNLLNSAAVLSANSTYGPAFMRPSQILIARFFKVGGRIDF